VGGRAVAAAAPATRWSCGGSAGELLVRLGDHLGGAEELETYALAVADVDERPRGGARREARMARAQLN
jgi:hypothetical protein